MGGFPTCKGIYILLNIHMIWVHHILPPIIVDAVLSAGSFGKMIEPPDVMFADVAVAPITGRHLASLPFKVGEVV